MGDPLKAGTCVSGSTDPRAAAEYIADLVAQLAKVARSANLGLLAYLLEIVALEAASIVRRDLPRRIGGRRLLLPDGHDDEAA